MLEAGSGGAALDLLDRDAQVDIALLDFAMPGMNGNEVASQIRTRRPGLPILFATGYADTTALHDASEEQIIRKPFAEAEVAEKLRTQLARAASASTQAAP